jgi:pilus assembly protein CpaE
VADETSRAALEAALKDRLLARSSVAVRMGGLPAAISFFEKSATPEILFVEAVDENSTLVEAIDRLAEVCDSGTRLIVLGNSNDIGLYRTLLRRGVSDYLVGPVDRAKVIEVIREIVEGADSRSLGRVMAFIGAKGGVGSTTIACNTSWTISQSYGEDVALIDLDIPFGSAALAFNLDAQQGIDNALADGERLDDALLERYMPRYEDHLSLLASPASLEADAAVDLNALAIVQEKVRRASRYVTLDLPHFWAPWTREILTDADEVVVTAAPDLVSLRNAKNLIDYLRRSRGAHRPVHYVLNQMGIARKLDLTAKDFATAIGQDPALVLPFDPAIFAMAITNGQMVGEISKRNRATAAFQALARTLCGREASKASRSTKTWFKGR